jgi:hypothetical protein
MMQGNKMFLFEKNNQKTFTYAGRHLTAPPVPGYAGREQTFFGSFVQKRTSFRHPPAARGPGEDQT